MRIVYLCLMAALCGCAQLRSRQVEVIGKDGESQRTTYLTVTTFFDAQSALNKLRSTTTDKTQGLSVGGLTEGSSGTNSVEALKALDSILGKVLVQ